jgi:hypothetical protein
MKKQLLVIICLATIVSPATRVEVEEAKMPDATATAADYALAKSIAQPQASFAANGIGASVKQKFNNSLAGGMPRGDEKGKRKNGRWRWNLWGKVC